MARLLRLVCWVVGHNWCDCPVCQVDNYFTLLCRRCRYMEDVKRSPYEPFAVNPALIETVRRGSTLIPFTDESTLGDIAAMLKKNPPKETHG